MRRQARTNISRIKLAILYSERGCCCAGCHKPLGEDVHVDHVVPLAGGGQDVFENLQLLHSACNQAKRDMSAPAWFALMWRDFLATTRPSRQNVTLLFKPELVERLQLAAYWSRQSMTALLEEGAVQALSAIEARGGSLRAKDTRMRRDLSIERWDVAGR